MAEIPIQRKEGRNIWPMLLGLLALLALLWFVFGRNRGDETATGRADSAAVASNTVMTDSAAGMTGDGMNAGMAGGAMGAASTTGSLMDADIVSVIHEVNQGEIASSRLAEQNAQNSDVKAFAREMIRSHTAMDQRGMRLASSAGMSGGSATGTTGATGTSGASGGTSGMTGTGSTGPSGAAGAATSTGNTAGTAGASGTGSTSGMSGGAGTALRDSITRANAAVASQLQGAGAGASFDRAYIDAQVTAHQNALAFLQRAQGSAQNADLKKMIDTAIPDVQKHLERARSIQTKVGQ